MIYHDYERKDSATLDNGNQSIRVIHIINNIGFK